MTVAKDISWFLEETDADRRRGIIAYNALSLDLSGFQGNRNACTVRYHMRRIVRWRSSRL
jgi:hypothetical protein